MTDIYLRRADGPDPRRRAVIALLVVVVAAAGAVFGYRYGCVPAREAEQTRQAVEADPLVDELIELADTGSPEPDPSSLPPPPPAPADRPAPSAAPEAPSSPTQTATTAPGGDPGARLIAEAKALVDDGAVVEAREKALSVLNTSRSTAARQQAVTLLSNIAADLVLTPRQIPEKVEYVVKPGDSLAKIAKKFDTTVDLLQESNNISGTVIRVGDRLRVLDAPFRIEIDKSENLLDLFLGDRFLKRYRVGTGEYSKTPVGDFKITDRIAKPTWWRPDGKAIPYGTPENELGTHWLSLDVRGYGIHGTWEPDTIGEQASAGCVRLLNEEIEELYTMVPIGTPVTIQD